MDDNFCLTTAEETHAKRTETHARDFDLISRQEAIETVRKAKSIGQAHRMLQQLPPAQQWTLCSEQLPKEEERSYWVCTEDGYQKQCRWKRYKGKDCYIYAWHSTLKVIAWMPLPQLPPPWKGVQDGKQKDGEQHD